MPIVWSIVVALAALVVLALLVVGLLRTAARTTTVAGVYRDLLTDRFGMLRARIAALRVRLDRIRARRAHGRTTPAPVESVETDPSVGGVPR